MYVSKYFEIKTWPEIERFIKETPLAMLVSQGDKFPVATHIPLELEDNEKGETVLAGHVAKANHHWKLFEMQPNVLAIFQSPVHHYISSSWYNHPNVPTWNYMSVHIYGEIKIISRDELWRSLERMTNHHEKNSRHPLSPEILHKEIEKQIEGIAGFKITVERAEAVYKMSQNRSDEDYKSIIAELERLEDYNAKMVARKMSELRKID